MAKKSTETPAKKAKKTPPEPAPAKQAAPVNGVETAAEVPVPAAAEEVQAEVHGEFPADETKSPAASEEGGAAEAGPRSYPAVVRSPKGLNLRVGPALNYDVLEVLPDGAEVTTVDMSPWAEVPGWRPVFTGERYGWVQARFLRLEQ